MKHVENLHLWEAGTVQVCTLASFMAGDALEVLHA